MEEKKPPTICKNCGHKIYWGRNLIGSAFAWYHELTHIRACDINAPQAEPIGPLEIDDDG